MLRRFMFATGIENSAPLINNGRTRIDELEKCGHYAYWKKDIDLVREMDIQILRYGPPLHTVFRGAGKFDWNFCDTVFIYIRQQQIIPIVDLCHFGVPDFIGDFQNPDFPALFAQYAASFARRYPWVQ